MVKSEIERLAIMEEKLNQNSCEHQDMKKMLESLNTKLDEAIEKKADKSELDDINKKLWGFATLFITAFFGILVYMIQTKLGG